MATIPDALAALEVALADLAAALTTGRPEAVLAAEGPLASAVQALVVAPRDPDLDPDRIRAAVRAARIALITCQLLGRASGALEQVVVPQPAYTASGQLAGAAGPAALRSRG